MPRNMPDGIAGRGSRMLFHAPLLCQKIREAYEQGHSMLAIERKLEADGVKTPYGGLWKHEAIRGAIVQTGGRIRTISEQKLIDDARRRRNVVPRE